MLIFLAGMVLGAVVAFIILSVVVSSDFNDDEGW